MNSVQFTKKCSRFSDCNSVLQACMEAWKEFIDSDFGTGEVNVVQQLIYDGLMC